MRFRTDCVRTFASHALTREPARRERVLRDWCEAVEDAAGVRQAGRLWSFRFIYLYDLVCKSLSLSHIGTRFGSRLPCATACLCPSFAAMDTYRDYDEHERWEIKREEHEHFEARDEQLQELGLQDEFERCQRIDSNLNAEIVKLKARLRREQDGPEATTLRDRLAELRADLANLHAEWGAKLKAAQEELWYGWRKDPKKVAEHEARQKAFRRFSRQAIRQFLSEHRRQTRHGKPDPRFTNLNGVSALQRITGEEKLWRLYVRPGVTTSVTFGKANPYWLKASEPGALVYEVWARSLKQARLLVKQDVRVKKGSPLPGIRRRRKIGA